MQQHPGFCAGGSSRPNGSEYPLFGACRTPSLHRGRLNLQGPNIVATYQARIAKPPTNKTGVHKNRHVHILCIAHVQAEELSKLPIPKGPSTSAAQNMRCCMNLGCSWWLSLKFLPHKYILFGVCITAPDFWQLPCGNSLFEAAHTLGMKGPNRPLCSPKSGLLLLV